MYLDSAATTKKLITAIQRSNQYYEQFNANVHRGTYSSAKRATIDYEQTRSDVKDFVNAKMPEEIVFTSGATESLNIIANGIFSECISGDHILILESEHHANFLPWFALAKRLSLNIIPIKLGHSGSFCQQSLNDALRAIKPDTAIVVCAHVSNALGNIYPVDLICEKARKENALSVIDGTQAVAHFDVDVQTIGCDFYAFSGHKMYAPTGIGVLYGKYELLERLMACKLGGEMITHVSWDDYSTQDPPLKFEAGTSNISGAIGMAGSVEFLKANLSDLEQYESTLFEYLLDSIKPMYQQGHLIVYGNVSQYFEHHVPLAKCNCVPILSFNIKQAHCYDVASYLSQRSLAVRAGHHCAMPLMQALEILGCVRVSLACYNDKTDIDTLVTALKSFLKLQDSDHITSKLSQRSEPVGTQQSLLDDTMADSISINNLPPEAIDLSERFKQTHLAILKANEWSEKHRQILLFSKYLPMLTKDERKAKYEIKGCEANVWLKISNFSNSPANYRVEAYSNSKVIRGLLAIIIAKLYIQPNCDLTEYFHEIGLTQYFSQGRRDGIHKIITTLSQYFNA